MVRRMMLWFVGVAVTWSAAEPAAGRLVESWPYERLFKEADLVIIAAPLTEETAEDKFVAHPWPFEVVAVNTAFTVRHVLKGEGAGKSVRVLTFRFGGPKKGAETPILEDGPGFVAFRAKPATVREGDVRVVLPEPEYLLFLKRLRDGRYEPVSGRVDPKFAVREMSEAPQRALGSGK